MPTAIGMGSVKPSADRIATPPRWSSPISSICMARAQHAEGRWTAEFDLRCSSTSDAESKQNGRQKHVSGYDRCSLEKQLAELHVRDKAASVPSNPTVRAY